MAGPYQPMNALAAMPSSGGQDETYAAFLEAQQREQQNEQIRRALAMALGAGAYMGGRPMGMLGRIGAGLGTAGAGYGGMGFASHAFGNPAELGTTDIAPMYQDAAGIPRVPNRR